MFVPRLPGLDDAQDLVARDQPLRGEHDRVEVRLEDHYWDSSDAAVVFERRDRWSGERRYIYHGNDGTSFPWNDTAQIDYLNAAAREQVIICAAMSPSWPRGRKQWPPPVDRSRSAAV